MRPGRGDSHYAREAARIAAKAEGVSDFGSDGDGSDKVQINMDHFTAEDTSARPAFQRAETNPNIDLAQLGARMSERFGDGDTRPAAEKLRESLGVDQHDARQALETPISGGEVDEMFARDQIQVAEGFSQIEMPDNVYRDKTASEVGAERFKRVVETVGELAGAAKEKAKKRWGGFKDRLQQRLDRLSAFGSGALKAGGDAARALGSAAEGGARVAGRAAKEVGSAMLAPDVAARNVGGAVVRGVDAGARAVGRGVDTGARAAGRAGIETTKALGGAALVGGVLAADAARTGYRAGADAARGMRRAGAEALHSAGQAKDRAINSTVDWKNRQVDRASRAVDTAGRLTRNAAADLKSGAVRRADAAAEMLGDAGAYVREKTVDPLVRGLSAGRDAAWRAQRHLRESGRNTYERAKEATFDRLARAGRRIGEEFTYRKDQIVAFGEDAVYGAMDRGREKLANARERADAVKEAARDGMENLAMQGRIARELHRQRVDQAKGRFFKKVFGFLANRAERKLERMQNKAERARAQAQLARAREQQVFLDALPTSAEAAA